MAGERILIVDDEESMVQFLSILLSKEGYEVRVARSGRDALQHAEEESFDVVITDIKMPGEIDGLGVLSGVKKIDPSIPVVIRTAFASQKSAIEALNRGAFQYLEKNAKNDEITPGHQERAGDAAGAVGERASQAPAQADATTPRRSSGTASRSRRC